MAFGGRYAFTPNTVEVLDLTDQDPPAALPTRTRLSQPVASRPQRTSITLEQKQEQDQAQQSNSKIIDLCSDDAGHNDEGGEVEFLREATAGEQAYLNLRASEAPRFTNDSLRAVVSPSGVEILKSVNVELADGDFLHIVHVEENRVSGILLRRCARVGTKCAMLPMTMNEVCAVLVMRASESRKDPDIRDALVWRPVADVIARRDVTFTNAEFPRYTFREDGKHYKTDQDKKEHGALVCRWKHVEFFENNKKNGEWVSTEEIVKHLAKEECTEGAYVLRDTRRSQWLNPTVQSKITDSFGLNKSAKRGSDFIDLTKDQDESAEPESAIPTQTYKRMRRNLLGASASRVRTIHQTIQTRRMSTSDNKPFVYADICSGGGGTTRAAFELGFPIKYLLDKCSDACRTLRLNWPNTTVLNKDISQFLGEEVDVQVDILHISFPCQFFSPCHTHDGKNDEANVAANLSGEDILKKVRPKVAIFEQTSGLKTHHRTYYEKVIQTITSAGYSIRAKIINCATLGNAQARKRLFIIASCPGEELPSFPAPTHGQGLKPLVTVNTTLSMLRGQPIEDHMRALSVITTKAGRPYDGNQPLRSCITTNGGEANWHPRGHRPFRLYELAGLQSFPIDHRFPADLGYVAIRTQIGNAVPVCVQKAILDECRTTMRKTDRTLAAEKVEVVKID